MTRVDFEIMLGLCGAYWNMISNNRIINYVSCFVDLRMFCIWRYANNTSIHSQLIGYGHVTKITVRPCQGWKSSGRFDCAEKALQGQCRSVSWSTFWGQNHGKTTPTRNRCAIGSINSHYFHTIGDKLINPISRGLYTHFIIRIPIKGGMTIPNIATFDHGTGGLNSAALLRYTNPIGSMYGCFYSPVTKFYNTYTLPGKLTTKAPENDGFQVRNLRDSTKAPIFRGFCR